MSIAKLKYSNENGYKADAKDCELCHPEGICCYCKNIPCYELEKENKQLKAEIEKLKNKTGT